MTAKMTVRNDCPSLSGNRKKLKASVTKEKRYFFFESNAARGRVRS